MNANVPEPLAVSSAKSKIAFLNSIIAVISYDVSQGKLYPFDKAIAVLDKDVEVLDDRNTQVLLGELWLKRYTLYIKEPFKALLKFPAMESCINSLAKNGSAAMLAQNEEHAAAIAHLCIRRVGYNITGSPLNNSLKCLLEQITGKVFDNEVLVSVEQTVDLLYGPGVWTLYSEDADTSFDLGTLLWTKGVKPHCIIKPVHAGVADLLSNVTWEL